MLFGSDLEQDAHVLPFLFRTNYFEILRFENRHAMSINLQPNMGFQGYLRVMDYLDTTIDCISLLLHAHAALRRPRRLVTLF